MEITPTTINLIQALMNLDKEVQNENRETRDSFQEEFSKRMLPIEKDRKHSANPVIFSFLLL